jgi:spore germination cell wall hydrolase CwlJ-like protein
MTGAEFLLAVSIYWEADWNDKFVCRVQIAHVHMVRLRQSKKRSMYNTIFKRKQFSWTKNARDENGDLKPEFIPPEGERWDESKAAARMVYRGRALNYMPGVYLYHADYVSPWWMNPENWRGETKEVVGKCGKHIFIERKVL